jgi:hypothetical protein
MMCSTSDCAVRSSLRPKSSISSATLSTPVLLLFEQAGEDDQRDQLTSLVWPRCLPRRGSKERIGQTRENPAPGLA